MAKNVWECIPSFDRLYNKVCTFVKKNQGRKGYISTQDKYGENILCLCYNDKEGINKECRVRGVRFSNDELQIVFAPITTTTRIEFTDEDFKDESNWFSINHEKICYYYTLIEIASSIDAYSIVKDKKGNEICIGDKVNHPRLKSRACNTATLNSESGLHTIGLLTEPCLLGT